MQVRGWMVMGAWLGFAAAARADGPGEPISTRWQRAQLCAGAHTARDASMCEARCEADKKTTTERAPVRGKEKKRKKGPPAGATCRCQCTAATLGVLEQGCGELGLVSGLAELGAAARACVSPGLSPEAACVLRCDDVLETCVDTCYHGVALVSEPTPASCISGCYAFQTSCLGLCADKGQRPASLNGSAKR